MLLLTAASGFKSIVQFLTVFALFLFVCVLTYFTTRFTAAYQKGKMRTSNIENVEVFRLSGNKYLQIVRIGERYFAIAVCRDSVSTVCELTKDELVMDGKSEIASPVEFKALFDKVTKKMNTKKQADKDEE